MPIRTTKVWIKATIPPTIVPDKFRQRQSFRTKSINRTTYQMPIRATDTWVETSTAAAMHPNKFRHRQSFRTKSYHRSTTYGMLLDKS